MLSPDEFERVAPAFPLLREADPQLVREFRQQARLRRIPAGHDVFVQGAEVEAVPLLLAGRVRVYQIGESGREVTLYRFHPGESCVLTANAALGRRTFPAIATAEEDGEAVMIPAEIFRQWVDRHPAWRGFYFELVTQRLASVMAIVDEVAFRRLDGRVAALLLERSERGNPVRVTHQEIAAELGSSREVISRILEDLAGRRLVASRRQRVPSRSSGRLIFSGSPLPSLPSHVTSLPLFGLDNSELHATISATDTSCADVVPVEECGPWRKHLKDPIASFP